MFRHNLYFKYKYLITDVKFIILIYVSRHTQSVLLTTCVNYKDLYVGILCACRGTFALPVWLQFVFHTPVLAFRSERK